PLRRPRLRRRPAGGLSAAERPTVRRPTHPLGPALGPRGWRFSPVVLIVHLGAPETRALDWWGPYDQGEAVGVQQPLRSHHGLAQGAARPWPPLRGGCRQDHP